VSVSRKRKGNIEYYCSGCDLLVKFIGIKDCCSCVCCVLVFAMSCSFSWLLLCVCYARKSASGCCF
jgi:hypothetical protein